MLLACLENNAATIPFNTKYNTILNSSQRFTRCDEMLIGIDSRTSVSIKFALGGRYRSGAREVWRFSHLCCVGGHMSRIFFPLFWETQIDDDADTEAHSSKDALSASLLFWLAGRD